MERLFADQTIEINAPAATVWDIITMEAVLWGIAFAELRIVSDWEMGSPVLWQKNDGTIIVEGRVTALVPDALLRFTVIDTQNPDRELARQEDDGITFELTEHDGMTTLRVRHGDFSVLENAQQALEGTMEGWSKTLPAIKAAAERSE